MMDQTKPVDSTYRLGIVGSRSLEGSETAYQAIQQAIEELSPRMIVSGHARGIDRMAEEVALGLGFDPDDLLIFPPEPTEPGRYAYVRACFLRNQDIVDESDAILAIMPPDGSRGTEDTIRRAKNAWVPVLFVTVKGDKATIGWIE